jgi:hypothetical protein
MDHQKFTAATLTANPAPSTQQAVPATVSSHRGATGAFARRTATSYGCPGSPAAVPLPQTVDEPQTVLDPQTVDEPHTVEDPQTVLDPQTVEDPHTVDWPLQAELPHTVEEPHTVEDPHTVDEPQTVDCGTSFASVRTGSPFADGASRTAIGLAAFIPAGLFSLLARAASRFTYPAPTVNRSYSTKKLSPVVASTIVEFFGKLFDAVFMSLAFTWSGVRFWFASSTATAPLVAPAAMLVPLWTK